MAQDMLMYHHCGVFDMAKSMIQVKRKCFVCGSEVWLEKHHVFSGYNRKKSEQWGMWVWLCHYHHNEPPNGVHFNRENELALKAEAQKIFEEEYGHKKFMDVFGKNYL